MFVFWDRCVIGCTRFLYELITSINIPIITCMSLVMQFLKH